jgi:hypothetical protein
MRRCGGKAEKLSLRTKVFAGSFGVFDAFALGVDASKRYSGESPVNPLESHEFTNSACDFCLMERGGGFRKKRRSGKNPRPSPSSRKLNFSVDATASLNFFSRFAFKHH